MAIILATTLSFTRAVESSELKDRLRENGFEVIMTDMRPPFLFDTNDVFAVVAGEPKLGEYEFSQFPHLKIVARFGRGLDNIDVAYAKKK